jgi:hypothetical protein
MSQTTYRIGGRVHKLITPPGECVPTSGIIHGDDGKHYFFLPSYMKEPSQFPSLIPEATTVQFAPRHHARGMRARNISVTSSTSRIAAHG